MSKQLLFVCAGKKFPQGAFNFLISLQQQETIHVQGLFLIFFHTTFLTRVIWNQSWTFWVKNHVQL